MKTKKIAYKIVACRTYRPELAGYEVAEVTIETPDGKKYVGHEYSIGPDPEYWELNKFLMAEGDALIDLIQDRFGTRVE